MTVLIIPASCIIPKYLISQHYFLYGVLSIYVPCPSLRGHIGGGCVLWRLRLIILWKVYFFLCCKFLTTVVEYMLNNTSAHRSSCPAIEIYRYLAHIVFDIGDSVSLSTNRLFVTRLWYLSCLEKVNSFNVKASEFYIVSASNKLTFRHVRVIIVALEKHYNIFWLCVCILNYPACIAHAPYYIVFCDLFGW